MSLLVCRKCKKIITSDTEPCPYCGEADPGGHQVEAEPAEPQEGLMSAGLVLFVFAALLILVFEWFSSNDRSNGAGQGADNYGSDSAAQTSCLTSECAAGTRTVTHASIQEPFYLCKSVELSEYANFVLSVMIKQARFADIAPEVSTKTGEPMAQGDDKLLLDKYRAKAGVSTFEQAISKCYRGRGNLQLVVLYSPKDSNSIYVAAEENQDDKYWLPKAHLFRR